MIKRSLCKQMLLAAGVAIIATACQCQKKMDDDQKKQSDQPVSEEDEEEECCNSQETAKTEASHEVAVSHEVTHLEPVLQMVETPKLEAVSAVPAAPVLSETAAE